MAKTVSLESNSFTGKSGQTYIIYPTLTTKRFEIFETLQVELEHSVTMSAFRQELTETYNLFDKMKFADGCTKLHNLLNGVERVSNKTPHPILMMCALFICKETEDQGVWSEAEAQEKIQDWCEIDISFFLGCAKRLVSHFMRG